MTETKQYIPDCEWDAMYDEKPLEVNAENVLKFLQHNYFDIDSADFEQDYYPVEVVAVYPEYTEIWHEYDGQTIALVRQQNGSVRLAYAYCKDIPSSWYDPGGIDVDYVENIPHWKVLTLTETARKIRKFLLRKEKWIENEGLRKLFRTVKTILNPVGNQYGPFWGNWYI